MNKVFVNQNTSHRQVALWLFAICILLLCMVAVGGYTRLTGSGLSITEWKPVTGAIPPLSEAAWIHEMNKYRDSPEYQKINRGFSLQEFKDIYWVEYLHRLLGRGIGFFFLLPLLYFLIKKKLTLRQGGKLLLIFGLGGLQGLIGWYMVQSGLVDNPHVSHFRLTLHLMVAMLIYGLLLWVALGYWFGYYCHSEQREESQVAGDASPLARHNRYLAKLAVIFMAWLVVQSALGGFVAGLKAGFIHNTFPLMDGQLLSPDAWALEPSYTNFLYNGVMVQFMHRANAILLLCFGLYFGWRARQLPKADKARKAIKILVILLLVQVLLGIATLVLEVPVWLGVLHQVYAFMLFGKALFVIYRLKIQPTTE